MLTGFYFSWFSYFFYYFLCVNLLGRSNINGCFSGCSPNRETYVGGYIPAYKCKLLYLQRFLGEIQWLLLEYSFLAGITTSGKHVGLHRRLRWIKARKKLQQVFGPIQSGYSGRTGAIKQTIKQALTSLSPLPNISTVTLQRPE